MYDERVNRGPERKFFALATEPFTEEGRMAIRGRIKPLFEAVKRQYSNSGLFKGSDEITLSGPRARLYGNGAWRATISAVPMWTRRGRHIRRS